MRNKIVAGNWKMNTTREEAFALATEVCGMVKDELNNGTRIILAPPFVHLSAVCHIVKDSPVKVAAQNCSHEISGAFTGEVSAAMIKSVGAEYVIIGHSERRLYFNETNTLLSQKILRVLEQNLIPIYCCGESLDERESGRESDVIRNQITEGLFHLNQQDFSKVIIAYEPVWAIGTGKTASSEQAQEMHAFIRGLISQKYGEETANNTSILYGGSCNEKNAKELFALADVDGGLIGGASLKSRSFTNIALSF